MPTIEMMEAIDPEEYGYCKSCSEYRHLDRDGYCDDPLCQEEKEKDEDKAGERFKNLMEQI
jgi:hypothetical protein